MCKSKKKPSGISTVIFFLLLRENTHHQPYTLTHTHSRTHLSSHNFIGWHATVVNDKGIDTLDSMMFGLFIFMYVLSYLLNGLCSSTAAARWFFSPFLQCSAFIFVHNNTLILYLALSLLCTHALSSSWWCWRWQTNRKISYQWLFHPENVFGMDFVFRLFSHSLSLSLWLSSTKTATTLE